MENDDLTALVNRLKMDKEKSLVDSAKGSGDVKKAVLPTPELEQNKASKEPATKPSEDDPLTSILNQLKESQAKQKEEPSPSPTSPASPAPEPEKEESNSADLTDVDKLIASATSQLNDKKTSKKEHKRSGDMVSESTAGESVSELSKKLSELRKGILEKQGLIEKDLQELIAVVGKIEKKEAELQKKIKEVDSEDKKLKEKLEEIAKFKKELMKFTMEK